MSFSTLNLGNTLNTSAVDQTKQIGVNTARKHELSMRDIASCTGSSRSILARCLGQLNVCIKTRGMIITDAKVAGILQANNIEDLSLISSIFADSAEKISSNTTAKTALDPVQVKKDLKNLKRAGDLMEIFYATMSKEATGLEIDPQHVISKMIISKAQQEVENAYITLQCRNEMSRHSPEEVLRVAVFDLKTLPEGSRNQLAQDFLKLINEQDNSTYPVNADQLGKIYQAFVDKTMAKADNRSSHPEAVTHIALMLEYAKPHSPMFLNLDLALGKVTPHYRLAADLTNSTPGAILAGNMANAPNVYIYNPEDPDSSRRKSTISANTSPLPSPGSSNGMKLGTKENAQAKLYQDFLAEVADLSKLSGKAKLKAMNDLYDKFGNSLPLTYVMRAELVDKLTTINADAHGKTDIEVDRLVKKDAVFNDNVILITSLLRKDDDAVASPAKISGTMHAGTIRRDYHEASESGSLSAEDHEIFLGNKPRQRGSPIVEKY